MRMFTLEEESFIVEHHRGTRPHEMAALVNEKYGKEYTPTQIQHLYSRLRLASGLNGGNRKGIPPSNKTPIGHERIASNGYVYVKVSDNKGRAVDNQKMKQIFVWEQHHGKIPKGYCVVFADGNKQNCDIDNLLLVSRGELALMNKMHLFSSDAEMTRTGTYVAKMIKLLNERKKENDDA